MNKFNTYWFYGCSIWAIFNQQIEIFCAFIIIGTLYNIGDQLITAINNIGKEPESDDA